MPQIKVRIPSAKTIALWEAKGRRYAAKMTDVENMRRIVKEAPQVLANLDRARNDLKNEDRQWYINQYMVFKAYTDPVAERLKELGG